jgi:hypothetical protein
MRVRIIQGSQAIEADSDIGMSIGQQGLEADIQRF